MWWDKESFSWVTHYRIKISLFLLDFWSESVFVNLSQHPFYQSFSRMSVTSGHRSHPLSKDKDLSSPRLRKKTTPTKSSQNATRKYVTFPRWLSLEVWCLFLGLCFRICVWNNHMSLLLFHVLRDMTTIIHISSTNIPVLIKDDPMLTICLQTFEVLTLAHSCVLCPPHKHRLALWTHVHTDSGCSPP